MFLAAAAGDGRIARFFILLCGSHLNACRAAFGISRLLNGLDLDASFFLVAFDGTCQGAGIALQAQSRKTASRFARLHDMAVPFFIRLYRHAGEDARTRLMRSCRLAAAMDQQGRYDGRAPMRCGHLGQYGVQYNPECRSLRQNQVALRATPA